MVRRGDIVTAIFGGVLGNKPRPALIVQDDRFDGPITVLAIPFTSGLDTASIVRPVVESDPANGLEAPSCLMADKLCPVRRDLIGSVVGAVATEDLARAQLAMQIMLGMMPA